MTEQGAGHPAAKAPMSGKMQPNPERIMRKLLIAGVSALSLLLSGAVYAQSSGGNSGGSSGTSDSDGGSTASDSGQAASGGAEKGASGEVGSSSSNSDTTTDRKDCSPGEIGVNCMKQPAQ
jgi:hypothetical protein